jgi:CRISPR-associated protein Cas6
MYWQEDEEKPKNPVIPDDVVDLVYSIKCRSLPVDHAHALYSAISEILPWLHEEDGAGVHPIHVAESGNGWIRPENADELLHLSRRTKLNIRVPKHRIAEAEALVGAKLDVAGNELNVEKVAQRLLSDLDTLFARYMVIQDGMSEEEFLQQTIAEMKQLGVQPRKVLPGKGHVIRTPEGGLKTSSLMLADLKTDESLILQQKGVGSHRHLGCGLFIPHKGIKEVYEKKE